MNLPARSTVRFGHANTVVLTWIYYLRFQARVGADVSTVLPLSNRCFFLSVPFLPDLRYNVLNMKFLPHSQSQFEGGTVIPRWYYFMKVNVDAPSQTVLWLLFLLNYTPDELPVSIVDSTELDDNELAKVFYSINYRARTLQFTPLIFFLATDRAQHSNVYVRVCMHLGSSHGRMWPARANLITDTHTHNHKTKR